jgi:hypothetical protein
LSLTQELEDEATFRPAARALFERRVADFRHDDPVTNCLPGGPADMLSTTYRIMQSRDVIAVLYENNTGANGRVTRVVLGQTEGEAIYTPKR